MKKYDSFAMWKNDQSVRNQKLIGSLVNLITKIDPGLVQSVKWGQGCFLDRNTPVIYIHAKSEYIQLGFYHGSSLKDPSNLLKGKGKYVRFIIIKTDKDIDTDSFTALINQVI